MFWLYAAAAALAGAGFADFPLISYHFQHARTVSPALTPVFYAVAMAVSGSGSLVSGRIFDRAGIGLSGFCVACELAAIPLILIVRKRMPATRPGSRDAPQPATGQT